MLILNNRWNGKSKVDWKWSKSNRKWLLCDAFKKGNFRHVVVYVAWVLFCKWNDKVQQDIENILYQNENDYHGALKQF